ncbi:Ig-like domain-containing protein [Promicromonospora iranensis]|uniref:Fibronectin type-III domain-containing protein n=1 Tax=Promicromonospora iranensis TaxID=1105144 RepID=A0ABU2CMW4_9MICO|nr:Ig-like domain-containing protein [Promicromonospora iranensis]MDR7382663.1 hypothetical protein [Promicromonospora iranensis]
MSFVSRVYENRRSAASAGAVALFGAGLVAFAFLYEGEATADVELNDSGVWVTQTASGQLGRFNYEAKALDGTLLANSANFDVEQDAQRVLLDDIGGSAASPVNPALLALSGTMKFPAGAQVAAGGSATGVYDGETGRLWVLPFDGATGFDEEKLKPQLKAGTNGELTVSNEGTVFLAVPSDGTLYTVPTSTQGVAEEPEKSDLPVEADAEVQVSAVGDEPVVLDESTGNLVLPGGDTATVEDGAQGALQQPSDAADNVVLATKKGLVTQPLGGGDATTRTAAGAATGEPSAPVQLGGCAYGAWSVSGQVVRDCPGPDNDVDQVLEGVDSSARLVYRVNRNVIVLNDVADGSLWMAADEFEKVDDWDLKMPEDAKGEKTESEEATPEQVDQFVADRTKANRPPEPKADTFGVRPGRTTVLNVLGNDMDPDGDVMTVRALSDPEGAISVDRVLDGAALQANVPADATGTTTFDYEVDDGRENGTAAESVTVKVVPMEENNPPEQSGEPVLQVGQEGLASIKVLPYFKDPDGDDLFLSNASTADPLDEVRFRPDGTIEFRDGGTAIGRKNVDVTVSDSEGLPVEGKLIVNVVASNAPPVAVQDHATVLTGEPITISPLKNDHDPNGDELRLTRVDGPESVTISPNQTAGTFKFQSDEPGSYDATYQVSDGPNPVTGLVRVDVVDPPEGAGAPVAVSDQVLLPTGGTALVDVLANDTDPAGGVLVVQGVTVPSDAPVKVAVLNHQILKISEVKRLDEPVLIDYKVANGTGAVNGQVRVVPIPASAQLRPPEAGPDMATVHTGDIVTIPVLKNDSHPDGLELTLNDELQEAPPASAGEAFVSEDDVRFRAGSEAGTVHAIYEVVDGNGQKDSAQVTINVVDGKENGAPALPDIEARVLSDGIVRIPLPLDGTDPDGDYVTLSSISEAPAKGTATIVDGFIDYQAAEDETGLDQFTYQAIDTRGAPAEGVVRVGIATKPASNQAPQAADDETTVRPGRTVAVAALDNDSDPDGDEIGLVAKSFEGTEDMKPRAVEDDVVVTAPNDEGAYSFFYGIQDSYKAKASGAITVNSDKDAPLLRPIAHDDVVTADNVEGSASVTVNVLENDVDPDGVAADLEVSVDEGLEGVTVTESGAVEVQLTESARVITYTVTDMDGLEAKAFVRVPGDQSRPHVKPGLGPLQAVSGEPLTIELDKYVVVREGREPRITEDGTVKALEGQARIVDAHTLEYTSAEDFAGAASVSFEVTDGSGPDDAEGLTAVLTLPIDVTPSKNLPPEITGTPVLEVAAGDASSVDLSRYVKDPDKDDLTFDVKGAAGIVPSVSGATVSADVEPSVPKGTAQELPLTVSDGNNPPVSGTLTVQVVKSTRPLAQTTPDEVPDAHQGRAVSVPVLANDTNPFPEDPLEVVGAAGETGRGEVSFSDSEVVITPDAEFHGVMTVRYTVQDATEDRDRQVDGIVKLTVLGAPEAPRAPRVEEVRSETVVLSWDQPNNNGADITGYTLRTSTGQEQACATTTCTFGGLKNNVKYTFTVVATNEVGDSDPSPASREARPDEKPDKPAAPTLEFGDSELTVSWKNQAYTDRSPIECVNLEISPPPTNGVTQKTCVSGSSTVWSGLQNGTAYTVSVQAKNAAPDPSDWSDPSAPETPAAPPAQPAAPAAKRVDTGAGGQIDVSWTAPANNGDPVKTYYLDVYQDGSKTKSLTVAGGTSQRVQQLNPESSYTFTVQAENKAGKSPVSAQSAAEPAYGVPLVPSGVQASNPRDRAADVRWNAISSSDFRGPGHRYEVQANGANGRPVGDTTSYAFPNLSNGTSYTFQVRACNQYVCSNWSASSNPVTPYGPVPKPTISAVGGDQKVTFTWNGRATNGRPIASVRVTGAISSSAASGTESASAGYSDLKEACVEVTDTEGQKNSSCDSARSDVRPDPKAFVTRGSSVNTGDCNTPACAYFVVNWSDFSTGDHFVECWSGTNPAESGWHNIVGNGRGTTRNFGSSSGRMQLTCYYGYANTDVAVRIDGKLYEARNW